MGAVYDAVELVAGGAKVKIWESYTTAWSELWAPADPDVTDVVLWDGVPANAEPVLDLTAWLTPFDLAVARAGRAVQAKKQPRPLVIVDLATRKDDPRESLRATAGRLPRASRVLPWASEPAKRLRDAISRSASGTQDSTSWDAARRSWILALSQFGSRHDAANSFAAYTLASGLHAKRVPGGEELWKDIEVVPVLSAFAELLRALGLLEEPRHATASYARPAVVANNRFGRFDALRCVMVDDQVPGATGGKIAETFANAFKQATKAVMPNADFEAWSSPTAEGFDLGAALRQTLGSPKTFQGWRARPLVDANGQKIDVLLLDLRLFPPEVAKSEKEFMGVLRSICQDYALTDKASGVDRRLREALQAALESAERRENGDGREMLHLALLPLLLAAADRYLPLIVISSAQQRPLLKLLAAATNIQVPAIKPAFSGYSDLLRPDEHAGELLEALVRAAAMHEERIVWEKVAGLEDAKVVKRLEEPASLLDAGKRKAVSDPRIDFLTEDFVREFVSHRYADALATPAAWIELHLGAKVPDNDQAKGVSSDKELHRRNWRVPTLLRNMRAHYEVRPIDHDDDLDVRRGALVAWLWLLQLLSDQDNPFRRSTNTFPKSAKSSVEGGARVREEFAAILSAGTLRNGWKTAIS